MTEDGLQLFEFQGRRNAEHTLVAVETAVRHEDVGVRIESEKIAKGLDGDDSAGNGIIFGNRLPEKDLQGFPSTAAEIGQKLPIIEKVTTEDYRDAEYEMAVRDLFDHIHAEPFPEFHHALLMA